MPSDSKKERCFFDRIYRIIWIFPLLSPLPDEGEKTQSRLQMGGKNNRFTFSIACL